MSTYLLIITIDVNRLNAPIRRLSGRMDKLTRPICMLPSIYLYVTFNRLISDPNTHGVKVMGWKKRFHANNREESARAAVLVSDKTDFRKRE